MSNSGEEFENPNQLLNAGWMGDHTVQTPDTYPHQWYTESVMSALGWSELDPTRAASEVTSLLRGQWSNGMVPHQVYAPEASLGKNVLTNLPFINDRRYWRHNLAPKGIDTSGVTQPPTLAVATHVAMRNLDSVDRKAFLVETVPSLIREAEWIYRERDFRGHGLATTIHPYESGMNYSPAWMSVVQELPPHGGFALLAKGLGRFAADKAVKTARSDKRGDDGEISHNLDTSLLAVQLSRNLGKLRQDSEQIKETWPYQVEDITFNSALVRNNVVLEELAEEAKIRLSDELYFNIARTLRNFDELYVDDGSLKGYYSRVTDGDHIKIDTVGSLMPLYAGNGPVVRQQQLMRKLLDTRKYNTPYPIPTVPADSPFFDPNKEDSGGVKPFMTWLIADGLIRADMPETARELLKPTIDTLERTGAKAISPLDGHPLDKTRSAATAGLVINARAAGMLLALRALYQLAS